MGHHVPAVPRRGTAGAARASRGGDRAIPRGHGRRAFRRRSARRMNLASTFAVLGPDLGVTPVPVTPTVYEELDRRFAGFKGHVLVAIFAFDADWPTWERHPQGDEVVCLLSGRATFLFEGRSERLE